ncbi:TPA: hypothetical protein U1202_001953 [Streptococcus suis]|nr:hypothetical protein [Streptococcus suis]HEM5069235.1 hypothetical protein [Streptococcus suis]
MNTLFILLLLISGFGIWYFWKKSPNKRNRVIAILSFIFSFILVGVTAPKQESTDPNTNESTTVQSSYSYTDEEAKEFAIYFKENAEVLDAGNKIDFIVGADEKYISARVGKSWGDESISRRIYLANELQKEKNRLFVEWLKSKDATLNSDDFLPNLIVTISDTDHTIIAQEYNGTMKIIEK